MRGATSDPEWVDRSQMYEYCIVSISVHPIMSTHHQLSNTTMLPRPLLTLIALLLLPLTLAQFGNFFQGGFPFGGGHFQGNQQDAPKSPGRQHKGWTEMESGEWGMHCV